MQPIYLLDVISFVDWRPIYVWYSVYRTDECSSPRSLRSLVSERSINIRVGIPVSKRQIDKSVIIIPYRLATRPTHSLNNTLTIYLIYLIKVKYNLSLSYLSYPYSYRSIRTLLDLSYLRVLRLASPTSSTSMYTTLTTASPGCLGATTRKLSGSVTRPRATYSMPCVHTPEVSTTATRLFIV